MDAYRRFAIYYTPPPGEFADFGASWLGWDPRSVRAVAQPEISGLDPGRITQAPRKYGFHATLKAPFRLHPDRRAEGLEAAVRAVAGRLSPVTLSGLKLSRIGSFLALTPQGDPAALNRLAGEIVTGLDDWRAPLSDAEIARRRPESLSAMQRRYLDKWGYPYVLDEFRFHMTLTGPLDASDAQTVRAALVPRLALLPEPFVIDAISLVGEAGDGRFHLIRRIAL
ncbi:putative phosphonate metabolism protein [Paracoccus isoporae]|uniref:Putative phosphonate metabolism protein n=1 Tax=Paracoccus isoporae TaxID=591205 RepID=A0A1G6SLR5_9RHOB|nr:DUF1045 domain-containing protein [Paracoccus isoporae]SDD17778.1 putative phosphonate metabolism protein [Paracoccus isoporae]